MSKFKKNDQVVDAHGNEYTVVMVESSTGHVAIKDNNTREPAKIVKEQDIRKA